ncbi:MAG: hypothetical protein U1B94_06635, partial [candidate division NC10 bacterium]|nr:hypothetical protein [candidate division NC10 bacterium]
MIRKVGSVSLTALLTAVLVILYLDLGPPARLRDTGPVLPTLEAAVPAKGLSEAEQVVIRTYREVSPAVVHVTSIAEGVDFFLNPVPQRGTGSGFI